MTCEQVRDELVAYAKNELPGTRHRAIDEHLARCQGCSRELEGTAQVLALTHTADEESVVRLVDEIIQDAIRRGATDIHLDGVREGMRVRLRVDGVLHETRTLTVEQREPVIARIKQQAGMNLTERRLPQTGQILLASGGKECDLRVSVCPFFHSEGIAMRILDRSSVLIGLDRLGLSPNMRAKLEGLAKQPSGLLISTGPTGSGKTTLLYSLLQGINSPEVNILTVEDPVEYLLPGVNQAAVNMKEGLSFPAALRTFLRHDPDVVMVAELRSLEIAELAVETSLTGHLVLSALHTRDAVEAVTRLKDIGIEPFLIASTLIGVLGHRLVRTVCLDCKTPYEPDEGALKQIGFAAGNRPRQFYRGAGCETCHMTGYKGRTGLFELLTFSPAVAEKIAQGAREEEIREAALADGSLTPFEADARSKITAGVTTVEEALRVRSGLLY